MNMPRLNAFPPSIGDFPRVLILGSMPGVESLRQQQYYAHPRNLFWPMMGTLFDFNSKLPYELRLQALLLHHIALWDVLAACCREGSLDSAITNPEPNDLNVFVQAYPTLQAIFCNGGTAYRYFLRFHKTLEIPVSLLPSTSPAYAALSKADKQRQWQSEFQKIKIL